MKKIYIAGSFSNPEEKAALLKMIETVRKEHPDYELFIPMEHFVPGGNDKDENGNYIMPNDVWARKVFENDINGLEWADEVIALYRGRYSGTGTAWEIGYAYAKGMPVTVYVDDQAEMTSLMIMNSATTVVSNKNNEQQ